MQDRYELLDGLKRAPRVLSAFVQTIPADKLDLRRDEGFWTIAEHVSHLAQVQPMLLDRLQRFASENHPGFIPYHPGKDEEEPATPPRMEIAAALEQFADYRSRELELLGRTDDATWLKTGTHPEYEYYSLYILVRHILMHDYWHMYRMEELWLTRDRFLTRVE